MKKSSRKDDLALLKEVLGQPEPTGHWERPKGGPRLPLGYFETLNLELLEAELTSVEAKGAGEMLALAMKERKKTQAALAKELGVGQPRVAQLTRKEADVELSTLKRVAQALGYDLEVRLIDTEGGKSIVGKV